MKKISTLLMLFCMVVGTAWADVVQVYTQKSDWTLAEGKADELKNLASHECDATEVYYKEYSGVIPAHNADGTVTVTFTYTGGAHAIQSLGAELIDSEGNVVSKKYHVGTAGNNHTDNVYTLTGVAGGEYKVRYYACHKSANHELNHHQGKATIVGLNPPTTVVTELANLSKNKVYTLRSKGTIDWKNGVPNNVNRGKLSAGSNATHLTTNTNYDAYTEAEQFAIIKHNEKYYLYSVAAKKFVDYTNEKYAPMHECGRTYVTLVEDGGYFELMLNDSHRVNSSTGWAHGVVVDYDTKDPGNVYEVASIDDVIFDPAEAIAQLEKREVTYHFYEGEVLKKSVMYHVTVGSAFPTVTFPFATVPTPEGTVTDHCEKDIKCTVELPFVVSEDFENATWYALKINSDGWKYVVASEQAPYSNSTATPVYNNGLWAFCGDVFNGFKIYNKQAGSSKTLSCDNSNNGTAAYMKNGEKRWTIQPGNGGFVIRQGETECLNDFGSQLKFWKNGGSPNGTGSAFAVVPETEFASLFETTKASLLKSLNCVNGYSESNREAITALTGYFGLMDFRSNNEVVPLEEGKFYRLQNYLRYTDTGHHQTDNGGWMQFSYGAVEAYFSAPAQDMKNVDAIFAFEKNGDAYNIKHVNAGVYLGVTSSEGDSKWVPAAENVETAGLYAISYKNGEAVFSCTNATGGQNTQLHVSGVGVMNYNSSFGSASSWYIVPANEINVTVTPAGYATLHLPFDVTLPNKVQAYAVETIEGGLAKLAEKADIPANTGAILEGEGTHTLTIAAASSDWANNKLVGTNVNTYVAGEAYVLGADGEGAGFFKATLNKNEAGETGSTHFLNNANKAYLPASAVTTLAATLRFNFGGNTTAIESVLNGVDVNAPIYDLSGRRVNNAVKGGIYIQNGKKFIVK